MERPQSPRQSRVRHSSRATTSAALEMIDGETGLGYVLPGILLENDSDMEDSLDNGYDFHSPKSEYHLQLESRIKTEIPDSCSEFFTLVTTRSCSRPQSVLVILSCVTLNMMFVQSRHHNLRLGSVRSACNEKISATNTEISINRPASLGTILL